MQMKLIDENNITDEMLVAGGNEILPRCNWVTADDLRRVFSAMLAAASDCAAEPVAYGVRTGAYWVGIWKDKVIAERIASKREDEEIVELYAVPVAKDARIAELEKQLREINVEVEKIAVTLGVKLG